MGSVASSLRAGTVFLEQAVHGARRAMVDAPVQKLRVDLSGCPVDELFAIENLPYAQPFRFRESAAGHPAGDRRAILGRSRLRPKIGGLAVEAGPAQTQSAKERRLCNIHCRLDRLSHEPLSFWS